VNGYNGTFEMVNPKELVIDHRYQRPLKQTLVSTIAQAPSWELFGVPVAFKRSNGMLYVADGQQRIAGVMASENPPKAVPVLWFPLHNLADEADVFVRINEWRKALQPIEKHKGKIVAGDEATLAIERAVAQAGYTIDTGVGSGPAHARTIQAVAGVGMIYNRIGEEGLLQTLVCIRDAWPDDARALNTHILRGVSELVEEQGENYNRTKLTNSLKKTEPHLVLRRASERQLDFGGSKLKQVRGAFAELAGLKMPKETKTAA
jgi:hypothetical protein